MIYIIAAVAKNGVIGKDNRLPWHIPEDMKRFRKLTDGKIILMGRRTFESILSYNNGKPLPNRKHIVISRQEHYNAPHGVAVFQNIEVALQKYKDEDIYVIGGGEIYRETLPYAERLYITQIDKEFEGDTYFPEIDSRVWQEVVREDWSGFSFVTYERKR